MSNILDFQYILRLIVAALCGMLIGYERKNRSKVAGVRTHCVVACASALMMVLSKYAYLDVMEMYRDLMKIDPSRIASGVVSGIGFLGAGMIFVNKKTVTGLTTAAGIWATSGIGMAIGAGLYCIGGAATLIILMVQIVLHITPKLHIHHDDELQSLENNGSEKTTSIFRQGILLDCQSSGEVDEYGNAIYTISISIPQEQEVASFIEK